jgi:Flp pilus assembly pilin Flp
MTRAGVSPPSPPQIAVIKWKDTDMCKRMTDRIWRRFGLEESGQDLVEYALLVALIVVVAVSAVTQVGTTIKTVFWDAIATATSAI